MLWPEVSRRRRMPPHSLGCMGFFLSLGAHGDLGTSRSPTGAPLWGCMVWPQAASCFSAIHLLRVACCPLCIGLCTRFSFSSALSPEAVTGVLPKPLHTRPRRGAGRRVSRSPFLLLLLGRMLRPGVGGGGRGGEQAATVVSNRPSHTIN